MNMFLIIRIAMKVLSCKALAKEFTEVRRVPCQIGEPKHTSLPTRIDVDGKEKQRIEALKEAGEKYSINSGVQLKFDDDDNGVDWDSKFSFDDTNEVIKRYDIIINWSLSLRCMLKYPSVVPSELSAKKLERLVRELRGFSDDSTASKATLDSLKSLWEEAYQENLDRVMFENLSSYEP